MSVSLNEVSRSEVKDISYFCIKSLFWVYVLSVWSHLTHPLLKEYLHVSQVAIFIISLKVKFSGPLWCENFCLLCKNWFIQISQKCQYVTRCDCNHIVPLQIQCKICYNKCPFQPIIFGGVLSRALWDNKLVDHHLKNIYTLPKFVNIDLSS